MKKITCIIFLLTMNYACQLNAVKHKLVAIMGFERRATITVPVSVRENQRFEMRQAKKKTALKDDTCGECLEYAATAICCLPRTAYWIYKLCTSKP
jgi:hypothetical protein